ncbi:MAG: binding-protein-dependent transport system inner rane component [Chloroflexi bacterium]|nr:binding-protein-dependent transport system inner rane component [Chloroflexota bacterium]
MRYLGGRCISSAIALLLVTFVVFFLVHLIPGDPVSVMLGQHATPSTVAALRHAMGFDQPLFGQYWLFMSKLFSGNLGDSISYQQPVFGLVLGRLQATLFLVAYSIVLSLLLAVPSALIAAVFREKPVDYALRMGFLVAIALPSFWIGTLLIYQFSLKIHLFPVAGYGDTFTGHLSSLFLPAFTLALGQWAILGRNLRSALIDVLQLPYVEFARMKGLRGSTVLFRHVLRTSLGSTVTIIGINLSFLIAGTVVVEHVFSIPGSGNLLVNAVFSRDYPIVQGVTLVYATLVILINLVTDFVYPALDPRVALT